MSEEEKKKMRKIITMTLIKIGIRCDLIGFDYLLYAIELVILDPSLTRGLCKRLYVKVGEHFNVTNSSNVERSIRHAIDSTYLYKNFQGLNNLVGYELYSINDKPTVGELIRLVADYYNFGMYND